MKLILSCFILLFSLFVRAQTFHKIYFFEDSIVSIPNVFPTDSGYYFIATEGNTTKNLYETLFGKLDLNGNVIDYVRNEDSLTNQIVMFQRSELLQNGNGNFTFGDRYRTIARMLTYSPQLIEILDTSYIDMYNVDSLFLFDNSSFNLSFDKRFYYSIYTYYDELNDDDAVTGYPGETGVQVTKHDLSGTIIWQQRFANPSSSNYKSQFSTMNLSVVNDSSLLLACTEDDTYNLSQEENNNARIHFFELDTAGNTVNHHIYNNIQFNYGWGGVLKTDSNLLVTSFSGNYELHPDGTSYNWVYSPVITCFNNAYEVQWVDTLMDPIIVFPQFQSEELLQNSDTSFVGVYTNYQARQNLDVDPPIYYALHPIEMFNKKISTGETLWKRHFRYFPEDSARRYTHQMYDIDLTPDGGYVMSGEVVSVDSMQAGRPGQYGYIAKTNCLGFFGAPQAELNYTTHPEFKVLFTNESVQAGSYLWIFGDGETLRTGEESQNIEHTYASEGFYNVELIAYGCDGENDTLRFELEVKKIEIPNPPSPVQIGDGSLLTLFPNPLKNGESLNFYVGNLETSCSLIISDNRGSVVGNYVIPEGTTHYFLPLDLSSGMYHVALVSKEKILEVEKLVVK